MNRFLVLLSLTPTLLYAGDLGIRSDSLNAEVDLDEVVVTATRTPKALKDAPVMTRVITGDDIKRADATDLQGLLQTELPGIEFSYAMNQQVKMNLSGFAGQSVLILVDGERLAGETMDNVDFSRLSTSGVARIEIVKGAASALYGSNAAGGVINIITKEAAKGWKGSVGGRYGSHGEWRVNGDAEVKGNHIGNTINISHYKIDTYTVCSDLSDGCDFRNVYGYKAWNISDKLNYTPTDNLKLTARASYYFKERYYNIDTPDRYRDFSAGLRGQWNISDKSNLEIAYSYDQYDKSDYLRSQKLDIRDYRNVLNSVRGMWNHQFEHGVMMTAGADATIDYLDTYQFAAGESKRQTNLDAFVQADWSVTNQWELIGALRYDYFSDARDSRLTSKINVRCLIGRFTLRGGYAQGFRAPTLKEKYMDFDMAGIFDIHGNPGLKPETSHNINISADFTPPSAGEGSYNFTLGCNYTFVNDKITTSSVRYASDGEPYLDYINVANLKVLGIEATAFANWRCGLKAKLSYAFTHEQTAGNTVTQYCPARPHSLTANISWSKEWNNNHSTDLTLSGRVMSRVSYNSMYMYEPFETRRVVNPGYTMWKVQINQHLWNCLEVTASVDNIFNYRPKIYTFNAPVTSGRTFLAGLNIYIDRI